MSASTRAPAASSALVAACLAAALVAPGPACKGTDDIHQTAQAKGAACVDCHATAYAAVKTPLHAGVFPTTCGDCHATVAWIPATQGHPEGRFPITTGSHANAGIACADCHVASLGPNAGGQNTDCTHCHLGAHQTPPIDATHAGVTGYPGAPASPHSCLAAGCHPTG